MPSRTSHLTSKLISNPTLHFEKPRWHRSWAACTGGKRFNGLDFDDHRAFHEKVESVAAVQDLVPIDDRHGFLALDREAIIQELESETHLVGGFEHPRTERVMDRDRRADDSFGQRVELIFFGQALPDASSGRMTANKNRE